MNSLSSAAAMAAALLLLLFLSMEAHAFSILLVGSTTSTRSQTYLAMSSLSLPRKISPDAFNDDNKRHTIHHIQDEQQHRAFLKTHSDKLVVIKYYSDVCKACKALAPKYRKLAKDESFSTLPIVFAEIPLRNNNDFFEEVLKLKALPSVQVYGGGVLLDSFPCPPTMFSTLTRKVKHWVQERINPITLTLKDELSLSPPRASEFFASTDDDDVVPLQLSDSPRINIVPAQRASEFFAGTAEDDFPFQPSDLFMLEEKEEEECPRDSIVSAQRASEFFESAQDDDDVPLQLSDMFLMEDD